jgi:hypothetical protein
MSTSPQNNISFRFEPWVLFEGTNGELAIEQSFKKSEATFAKGDRCEIASEVSSEDTIQLVRDINAKAKELLGDKAPKLLGFHAVVVDSPENPAVHNKAVHVVLLFETDDGNKIAIPYVNSLGNELTQAQKKLPELGINPDDVEKLITASFNWMLDPKGGNVRTIGVAFDYDKHAASYGTPEEGEKIPPTYKLFAGVDATGESKKEYTDGREYDVLHAYWLGEKEEFAKPAAQDADPAIYLIDPEDGLAYLSTEENQEHIAKPEAQGSGSIVYLLEPKDALSYFFAEENTDLRAWVYETRHLIQEFERTHDLRATEAQRLENMVRADETLTAFVAAQQATTR